MCSGSNNKGIALLAVLVILLVVATLADAIMFIMLNQSRLTLHKMNRTRAYYAAMAGINLAYENLRTNSWLYNTNYCINYSGNPPVIPAANTVPDPAIPYEVRITIGSPPFTGAGPSGTTPIQSTVNYTFQ